MTIAYEKAINRSCSERECCRLRAVQKIAAFLVLIGLTKGKKIMNLMDSDELKNVLIEMEGLPELSPAMKDSVWHELLQLGYEETMTSVETLGVLRQFCNGGKISNQLRK